MVWKGVPMKKLLFIVNPRAGKTRSRAPLFDAAAEFSRAGYLVNIFVTEAGGQARDMAARCGGDYDLIVTGDLGALGREIVLDLFFGLFFQPQLLADLLLGPAPQHHHDGGAHLPA